MGKIKNKGNKMNIKKITARDIIKNPEFDLSGWFYNKLISHGGSYCSRIYLDLNDMTLFESVEANSNSWLQRDDGSLQEVDRDEGWGADLTEEEMEWLEEDGISDFGFQDWIYELEDNIQKELDLWYKKLDEKND